MRAIILIAALYTLAGCGWSFPFLPGNPPDRQFNHVEREVITPAYVELDGKQYHISYKVERDYAVGLNQQQPKIPGWKRVLNAIFGWSLIGGIFVVVSSIFFPALIPLLISLIGRLRARNKQFAQVVKSVDQGLAALPDTQKEVLKTEMSKVQDTDTKKAVVKTKEGI